MTASSRRFSPTCSVLILLVCLLLFLVGFLGWFAGQRLLLGQRADTCAVSDAQGQQLRLSREQAQNAAIVSAVTIERNMLPHAALLGLATVSVETDYYNVPYGDRDSLGLFQQRPSMGWGTPEQVQDPIYASNAFYNHLEAIENYQDLPVGETAQRIQLSGYPDRYAEHVESASPWAAAFTGSDRWQLTCTLPASNESPTVNTTDFAEALTRSFGASISLTHQDDDTLTVQATGSYTGADSLSESEANRAVLQAVTRWSLAHTRAYPSVASVAYGGKMWVSSENIGRWWGSPTGWQDSASASIDAVTITF